MSFQLTPNAIRQMIDYSANAAPLRDPILQIMNLKPITSNQQQTRFRVIISDGTHYTQAVLSAALNPLVEQQQQVVKNVVVQLTNYTVSNVSDKRLIIVTNLTVLGKATDRIGDPKMYGGAANTPGTTPAPTEPPSKMTIGGGYTSPTTNPFQPQPESISAVQAIAPVRQAGLPAGTSLYPIRALSPYQNRWTIRARVSHKSDVRSWNKPNSSGKLFSMTLLDDSGEIKATAFKDQVDKFFDHIHVGHVYYFSRAKVNVAKPEFNTVANDYELVFERDTEVIECEDQTAANIPQAKLNIITLDKLGNYEKNAMVDMLVVVHETHDVSSITSKAGNPLVKRDLVVVDASGYEVRLTLWGSAAETFDGHDKPVIGFKSVRVNDFGGRSLSYQSVSQMVTSPDMPEAHQLRGWYDAQGHMSTFQKYSSMGGGGGSNQVKTISQVKDQDLGVGDKPDFFTIEATVMFARQEGLSYPACPTEGCNKKVVQDGSLFRCDKCDRTFTQPDYRYMANFQIADHTGQIWILCFNEIALGIIGMTANELHELQMENEISYNRKIAQVMFTTYRFKCKAKQENFNDLSRVRYSAVSATPIIPEEQSKELIVRIKSMSL